MATLPKSVWSLKVYCRVAEISLVLLAAAAAGCANRAFRPGDLPRQFLAPATENVQEANLGKLACAVNSQLIDRGDVLEVSIVTDYGSLTTTTTPVRVDENGIGDVPLIGQVRLAGLDLEGAEDVITSTGIGRGVFRNPHVTVTMKQQRMNVITVIGAVEEEGMYELPRRSSFLLAALVEAGGLSDDAGSDVEIRRPARGPEDSVPGQMLPPEGRMAGVGGAEPESFEAPWPQQAEPRITRVNLAAAAAEGRGGLHLDDGDVVIVSKRAPKPVSVMGLVVKPDTYEMPPNQDLYLLDALAKAGDRTMSVADNVIVRRQVAGRAEPVVIKVSIRDAQSNSTDNIRLAPGDVVIVEDTPLTFVVRSFREITRVTMGGAVGLF